MRRVDPAGPGFRGKRLRRLILGLAPLALSLGLALPLAAQIPEVTADIEALGGSLGYAHPVTDVVYLGLEAGAGMPLFGATLDPDGGDFKEYLHFATFVRLRPSGWLDLDMGVRASAASLWECTASDCLPAPFFGGYLQPMVGGERWKVGARLSGGWIDEPTPGEIDDHDSFVLAVDPLIVRYFIRW